jgi:urease accessory protein
MPLSGHLRLICAPDASGASILRHQSFAAPVHLSKPHWDGASLLVNVVNPTAGLFAGDLINYDIAVEPGARLVLASPSAARAHQIPADQPEAEARVDQRYTVAAGARLEVWPELFIPQAGARYRQTTRAEIAEGGEFFLFEAIAPGRTASGEAFAYDRLVWDTDIRHAGQLVVRERFSLASTSPAVAAMRARFPTAYYASAWLFSPRLDKESPCWGEIAALHGETAWLGFSPLCEGGWAVKLLAADSLVLRKTLTALRGAVYGALGTETPSLRRY